MPITILISFLSKRPHSIFQYCSGVWCLVERSANNDLLAQASRRAASLLPCLSCSSVTPLGNLVTLVIQFTLAVFENSRSFPSLFPGYHYSLFLGLNLNLFWTFIFFFFNYSIDFVHHSSPSFLTFL